MLKLLISLPLAFVAACWGGYVLSVMWAWFIVPVFQAPTLRIPYAIGLALVMSMLTHQHKVNTEDDTPAWAYSLFSMAMGLVFLVYGWIVKAFV